MIKPPFTGPVRTIEFRLSSLPEPMFVLPYVDGHPITAFIEECEVLMAQREHAPESVIQKKEHSRHFSRYVSWSVHWNYSDLVNTVASRIVRPHDSALLAVCRSCGDYGCSNYARVKLRVTDSHVHWHDLRTCVNNKKPYPDFGIITFDRAQYEESCERLYQSYLRDKHEKLKVEMLDLEESFMIATMKLDQQRLDQLVHPEFTGITGTGSITRFENMICEGLEERDKEHRITDFSVQDLWPNKINPPQALSCYTLIREDPDGSMHRFRKASLWVRGELYQWQLIHHQSTPIL